MTTRIKKGRKGYKYNAQKRYTSRIHSVVLDGAIIAKLVTCVNNTYVITCANFGYDWLTGWQIAVVKISLFLHTSPVGLLKVRFFT